MNDNPSRASLYQYIATELCLARGRHVCGNTSPPPCNLERAEQIMERVDRYAVMPIVAELAADLDHAERENRRLRAENDRLKR